MFDVATDGARSPSVLEELTGGSSELKSFIDTYLLRKPFAVPSRATRFHEFINKSRIEKILSSSFNNCWLAQNGRLHPCPHLQEGRLTPAQADENFKRGWTVLVRHAEQADPDLAVVAADFFRLFRCEVDIQLYMTPSSCEGFDWHIDREEVFVIQSSGKKEFRLRPESPLCENRPPYEVRCLLYPGDWLYIPSGWWHKAYAVTESCHMSVGVKLR